MRRRNIALSYCNNTLANCDVFIPGSKSYTNRALVISALADGVSVLSNCLFSDDTNVMIDCLRKLGIAIEIVKDSVVVHGRGGSFDNFDGFLDCGIAGTTTRFLTALTILNDSRVKISASGEMTSRPMKDLIDILEQFGKKIEYCGEENCVPMIISGTGDKNLSKISISGSVSSQFISGILMIAPLLKNGLEITVKDKTVSKSYIDLTIDVMQKFGANVEVVNYERFVIRHKKYIPQHYAVESDWSSAVYFFAYTALSRKNLLLHNLNLLSKQGDRGIVEIFRDFGVNCIEHNGYLELLYDKELLKLPSVVDMENMPDTAMTVAMVASVLLQFGGSYRINGLATLKKKETNRLLATKNELESFGYKVEIGEDFIILYGAERVEKKICYDLKTYSDHRVAMTFSLMSILFSSVVVEDCDVINKSYPEFWNVIGNLGFLTREVFNYDKKIILIGFRGCGKSYLGSALAGALRRDFVDLDEKIEGKIGCSIANFVKNSGWEAFRIFETIALIEELEKQGVRIIALGGGCCVNNIMVSLDKNKILDGIKNIVNVSQIKSVVSQSVATTYGDLQQEIVNHFRSNSLVFNISASLENVLVRIVSDKSRPILGDDDDFVRDTKANYSSRHNSYISIADFSIENDDNIEKAVDELMKIILC